MITNWIEPHMGKMILNHLVGNNCPLFHNGLPESYFFKLNVGSDCLGLCFWTIPFKTILTQYYYKNINRFQTRTLNTSRRIYRL